MRTSHGYLEFDLEVVFIRTYFDILIFIIQMTCHSVDYVFIKH